MMPSLIKKKNDVKTEPRTEPRERKAKANARLEQEGLSKRVSGFKNNGALQLSRLEAIGESEEEIHHLADLG